jgi:hypothetical protein
MVLRALPKSPTMIDKFRIRHPVVFNLKHAKGSVEEKKFLEAARKLASIEGVRKFESLKEISNKNNYDYGLSMEFNSVRAYEAYQKDPAHEAFVQTYWVQNVKEFLGIDYE